MRFMSHRRTLLSVLVGAALAGPGVVAAQAAWPTKPVKIVVPYAAGGPADVMARELAQRLAADTGQPFVIDNQGGGLGLPALGTVSRAEPDGHTLYLPALDNVVLQPQLFKNAGAEQLARLQPISLVSTGAHVLVVSAKLPVTSVPLRRRWPAVPARAQTVVRQLDADLNTPAQFDALYREAFERYRDVVKSTGFTAEV